MADATADRVKCGGAPDTAVSDFLVDRREERTSSNLTATIRLPGGEEIRCIVKDVSKSGARLGIPRGCVLPERFMFRVNGRDFVFQVRLAWQRDCYAGVRIERIARLAPNFTSA